MERNRRRNVAQSFAPDVVQNVYCALYAIMLYLVRRAVPPMKGGAVMVTWSELIQLGLLIVAIIAVIHRVDR